MKPQYISVGKHTLTLREVKILKMEMEGLSRKEIAIELEVSLNTLNHQFYVIHGRLGIHRTFERYEFCRLHHVNEIKLPEEESENKFPF